MIVDGTPSPTDILNILGIEALAEYMVKEVQKVYRLQGVLIDDKHIECITNKCFKKPKLLNQVTVIILLEMFTIDLQF